MYIWLYWENKKDNKIPDYIKLCRRILKHKCVKCDICLVTPFNIHNYLPDLNPKIWEIKVTKNKNPIALRCDYIRALLLKKYGGLYIDSDCIVLKDLYFIEKLLYKYDFLIMRRNSHVNKHVSIGFYGSNKNGIIITEYVNQLNKMLNEQTIFNWIDLGSKLLTPIVNKHESITYFFKEKDIQPITANIQKAFIDTTLSIDKVIDNDTICFMLYHRIFENELKDVTVEELYSNNWLISKILNKIKE